MAISEEEIKKLIEVKAEVDRTSSVSSDGSNLLTRIPSEVVQVLKLKKGDKIRWLVDPKDNKIKIEIIK